MYFYVNQFTLIHLQTWLAMSILCYLLWNTPSKSIGLRNVKISLIAFCINTFSEFVRGSVFGSDFVNQATSFTTATTNFIIPLMASCAMLGFPSLPTNLETTYKHWQRFCIAVATVVVCYMLWLLATNQDFWHVSTQSFTAASGILLVSMAIRYRAKTASTQPTLQNTLNPTTYTLEHKVFFKTVALTGVMPLFIFNALWLGGMLSYSVFAIAAICMRAYLIAAIIVFYVRFSPFDVAFLPKVLAACIFVLMIVFNGLNWLMATQIIESAQLLPFAQEFNMSINDMLLHPVPALALRQYVHQGMWPLGVTIIVTNLGIMVGGHYFFKHTLLKPLAALTAGVGQVRQGNFDAAVERVSNDELGILAEAFNQATASMRRSQTALNDINATLEERVVTRTRELEAAKISAEKANKAKSLFLGKVSHEFRTPLNAIMGFAQLLAHKHPQDTNPSLIRHSGQQLLGLINNVLSVVKGEFDQIEAHPTAQSLNPILAHIMATMSLPAQLKGITLQQNIGKLPKRVMVDGRRLQQVLLNLLNSTLQNSSQGHISLRVGTIHQSASEAIIFFGVSGSDLSDMSALQQSGRHTPKNEADQTVPVSGQELGMVVSQQLVKLMGGTLHSGQAHNPNNRFWFTLTLPLVEAPVTKKSIDNMSQNAFGATMVIPPAAQLRKLQQAAHSGNTHLLEKQLHALQKMDGRYASFVEQALAQNSPIQLDQLRQWLKGIDERVIEVGSSDSAEFHTHTTPPSANIPYAYD